MIELLLCNMVSFDANLLQTAIVCQWNKNNFFVLNGKGSGKMIVSKSLS